MDNLQVNSIINVTIDNILLIKSILRGKIKHIKDRRCGIKIKGKKCDHS